MDDQCSEPKCWAIDCGVNCVHRIRVNKATINIKPLSANEAFNGRKTKTAKYRSFERSLLFILPKMTIPNKTPLRLSYEFGFSNLQSDIDNAIKQTTDVLSKKYSFNDMYVMELNVKKFVVTKGQEYIKLNIEVL